MSTHTLEEYEILRTIIRKDIHNNNIEHIKSLLQEYINTPVYNQLINNILEFSIQLNNLKMIEHLLTNNYPLQEDIFYRILHYSINYESHTMFTYIHKKYKIKLTSLLYETSITNFSTDIAKYILHNIDTFTYDMLIDALINGYKDVYTKALTQLDVSTSEDVMLTLVEYNYYDIIEELFERSIINYSSHKDIVKKMLYDANDTHMFNIIYKNIPDKKLFIEEDKFDMLRKYTNNYTKKLVLHVIEMYASMKIDFTEYYHLLDYEDRKYLLEFYNIKDIVKSTIDVGLHINQDDINITNYTIEEYIGRIKDTDRQNTYKLDDTTFDVEIEEKLIKDIIIKDNIDYIRYLLSIKPFDREALLDMIGLSGIVSHKDNLYNVLEELFGGNVDFINMMITKYIGYGDE